MTSAHAVRILYNRLTVKDKIRLLRTEWLFLLIAYIGQGRPIVQVDKMLAPYQKDHPWSQIIEKSMDTDDQHVPKLVHAMRCAEYDYGEQQGRWRSTAALTTATIKREADWEFHGHGQTSKGGHSL